MSLENPKIVYDISYVNPGKAANNVRVSEDDSNLAKYRPNLLILLARYLIALTKWTLAGMPERSVQEYKRVRAICESCTDYWDPVKEACSHCGCGGKENGPVWRNKQKMTTEKCPIGKW